MRKLGKGDCDSRDKDSVNSTTGSVLSPRNHHLPAHVALGVGLSRGLDYGVYVCMVLGLTGPGRTGDGGGLHLPVSIKDVERRWQTF